MNKIDLNGRCAVVTGGAQGFGRAIAERFVASGAKVAIWDHDLPFAERTAKEIGAAVTAFKVDVSELAAVEKTRDETLKAFGKIDILVNNAGIAGINKTVWETDLEEWRKVLRINLDGPFICCRAIVPSMVKQNYGRIVNIASIAGKGYAGASNAGYVASKGAVISLTKTAAQQLGRHNINVNAICPGVTRTALSDANLRVRAQQEGLALEAMERRRAEAIPLQRANDPEDIAAMVVFLASPGARNITGQSYNVDGGLIPD